MERVFGAYFESADVVALLSGGDGAIGCFGLPTPFIDNREAARIAVAGPGNEARV